MKIKNFQLFFIGPFEVLKHVSKLAYCIELPSIYYTLYSVFHVYKLKLYVAGGGYGTSTNVQPVLVDVEEQYEAERIMAESGHGNHKQYLVCWAGYLAEHDL